MIDNSEGHKEYCPTNRGSTDRPWQDEEVLRDLYVDEGLSMEAVAEKLGCAQKTVHKWIHQHGIQITDPRGRGVKGRRIPGFPAAFGHRKSGSETVTYEVWRDSQDVVTVHRLLAVAEYGFDALDRDVVVHHENGIGWDNRPENIELMDHSEHSRLHAVQLCEQRGGWVS